MNVPFMNKKSKSTSTDEIIPILKGKSTTSDNSTQALTDASSRDMKASIPSVATPKTSNRVSFHRNVRFPGLSRSRDSSTFSVSSPCSNSQSSNVQSSQASKKKNKMRRLMVKPLYEEKKQPNATNSKDKNHKAGFQSRMNKIAAQAQKNRPKLRLGSSSSTRAAPAQLESRQEIEKHQSDDAQPSSLLQHLEEQSWKQKIKLAKRREFNRKVLKVIRKNREAQARRERLKKMSYFERMLDSLDILDCGRPGYADRPVTSSHKRRCNSNPLTNYFTSAVTSICSCDPPTKRRYAI